MTEEPRIVDQAAHTERVDLDRQIADLTAELAAKTRPDQRIEHHEGLLRLQELQRLRRDAFRREVGYPPR
ncbi:MULTISPECIES: hypothetical protein [Nocardia]|uniref:hypothetical protein n=1 Tax=Nocardia TaxID=1817 RepID=UPI002454B200|nr:MULTISPECIES: hypothetical protein [Nocardia]